MPNPKEFKRVVDILRGYETKGQEWILDNLIFLAKTGSHLYGTNVEDSDDDYVGVTYAPSSYWLGIDTFTNKVTDKENDEIDYTIYDFRQFVSLASKSNPNILEIVWIPPDHDNVLYSDYGSWETLIYNNRWKFHTQRTFNAFSKFAVGQIRKLKNIQSNKPSRAAIKAKYGWDTKFAAHTMRILDEATRLMEGKDLVYPVPHADYYRQIRTGQIWGPGEFNECIEHLEQASLDFESTYALASEDLPTSCDRKFINALLTIFYYNQIQSDWDYEEAQDYLDDCVQTVQTA